MFTLLKIPTAAASVPQPEVANFRAVKSCETVSIAFTTNNVTLNVEEGKNPPENARSRSVPESFGVCLEQPRNRGAPRQRLPFRDVQIRLSRGVISASPLQKRSGRGEAAGRNSTSPWPIQSIAGGGRGGAAPKQTACRAGRPARFSGGVFVPSPALCFICLFLHRAGGGRTLRGSLRAAWWWGSPRLASPPLGPLAAAAEGRSGEARRPQVCKLPWLLCPGAAREETEAKWPQLLAAQM